MSTKTRHSVIATPYIQKRIGASSNDSISDRMLMPKKSGLHSPDGSKMYFFDDGDEGVLKFPDDVALKSYRNGYYQHIYWLGVGGYLIINHHDKEILLIDPWHSYSSFWLGEFPFTKNRPMDCYRRMTELVGKLKSNQSYNDKLYGETENWNETVDAFCGQLDSGAPFEECNQYIMKLYSINEKEHKGINDSDYSNRKNVIDEMLECKVIEQDCYRLGNLASFIRTSVNLQSNGTFNYLLTGILLSHTHFDHGDDLAMLLTLLQAPKGKYIDKLNGRTFGYLMGPPLYLGKSIDKMPVIYCDYEAMYYHRAMFFDQDIAHPYKAEYDEHNKMFDNYRTKYGVVRLNGLYGKDNSKWKEFTTQATEKSLYYTDGTNKYLSDAKSADKCPDAGTRLKPVTIGSFLVEPYVWDHMNTGSPWQTDKDVNDNHVAGSYERISVFLIRHKQAQNAKRTLVIGSSGEMGLIESAFSDEDYSKGYLESLNPKIETDLLIQSVQGKYKWFLADFTEQVKSSWRYILANIKVKDAIIFSHWESYVQHIAKKRSAGEDYDTDIRDDMRIVNQNIDMLRTAAFDPTSDDYFEKLTQDNLADLKRLIADQRIYILGRLGYDFEYPVPEDAEKALEEYRADLATVQQ